MKMYDTILFVDVKLSIRISIFLIVLDPSKVTYRSHVPLSIHLLIFSWNIHLLYYQFLKKKRKVQVKKVKSQSLSSNIVPIHYIHV